MTDEFVHSGQTFTGDGNAYCPLERKRRGPAALAAALSVMVAGGAILTLAAMSIPADLAPADPARTLADIAPQPTAIDLDAPAAADADAALADTSIADALAESRAARAALALDGGEPVNIGAAQDRGFAPSLKPSIEVATTDIAPPTEEVAAIVIAPVAAPSAAQVAVAPAISSVASRYADVSDDPPPFFFESDVNPLPIIRVIPAVAYAGDMARAPGEVKIRIKKGENFVDALKRAGVDNADANAAAYAFGKHQDLRRLLPGQELVLTVGWPNQTLFEIAAQKSEPPARLLRLEFRADAENRISLHREPNGAMAAEKKAVPLTTRVMSIAGQIDGSLYLSAKHVGAPDETIANLANAFAYDVDFQREIFGGDEFEALFEVQYDDRGQLVTAGDILYARLKWRGRQREKAYYRFADNTGLSDFYDVTGQSAKRLLMKTPIDGARLSSGFGSRKHPILGYRKEHKGVDFAASRGTPIKAAGDGIIERADRYGSFGNYVKIRHANGYETAYAHMNGFGRGIRKGVRVRQGDIIGYVGTTGRSTGPHLHYEVHLKGVAVNPQNLKIATGKQLTGKDLDRFKAERARVDAMRMAPAEREALYAREDASKQGAL